MKNFLSVCKNVIASNNKRNWCDPAPAIRVSKTASGTVISRYHSVGIVDARGNIVARMVSTQDGNPVIKCGAKVALVTEFPVVEISENKIG